MGFYDDLKKPAEKAEPERFAGFDNSQRNEIARDLRSIIMFECSAAKDKSKRSYHGFCRWCLHESESGSIWGQGNCCKHVWVPYQKYHTQTERDAILQLLRRELETEGFPADCVRPYDYTYGTRGLGPFKRGVQTLYTIEVDVRW